MSLSIKSAEARILLIFAGTVLLLLNYSWKRKRRLALPPGPPRLPFIGSAHIFPNTKEWLTFYLWGKQYGDVIYLSVLGKPMIILNSAKAVVELLDQRGSIYSDRPTLHMAGELVGWKDAVPLRQYDSQHRESRKLLYNYLSPRKVSEKLHPIIEQKTIEYLLRPLLKSPDNFMDHVRNTVAATVLFISNGHVISESDPLIDLSQKGSIQFGTTAAPGAYLVDILPILRYVPEWFPGANFKRIARLYRETTIRIRDEAYLDVKDQVMKGTARPSFTAELIQSNPNPSLEEEYMYRWSTTAFYGAGVDTTISAMSSFVLAMILYPDTQAKAQEELDRVIGSERLPSFSDRENLPYLEAVIKEVVRYGPVAPLAIPHKLAQEDEYRGYRIPKDSVVFANSWAILHDSILYPYPFKFSPERFLKSSDEREVNMKKKYDSGCDCALSVNPDPEKFAFGYGRRVCPGIHFADASLWIVAATMLAAFKILPFVDANGKVELPKAEYTPGLISHPEKFRCKIIPRSTTAANFINDTTYL